jgi:hypothetical protein
MLVMKWSFLAYYRLIVQFYGRFAVAFGAIAALGGTSAHLASFVICAPPVAF